LDKVIVTGLVTPLPLWAHGVYPPLHLDGITSKPAARPDKDKKGDMFVKDVPKKIGPDVLPGFEKDPKGIIKKGGPKKDDKIKLTELVQIKDLLDFPTTQADLYRRLKNQLFYFSTDGVWPPAPPRPKKAVAPPENVGEFVPKEEKKDDNDDEEGFPDGKDKEKEKPPAEKVGTKAVEGKAPLKCLVRFIDADVKPEHTYVYAVAVRIKNPNYKNFEEVAFRSLAETRELSPLELEGGPELPGYRTPEGRPLRLPPHFRITNRITIPPDWDYYVTDEKYMLADPKKQKWPPMRGAEKEKRTNKDFLVVQVHHWLEKLRRQNMPIIQIGEWVIAERQVLQRGERIGRGERKGDKRFNTIRVDVPEWIPGKAKYELAASTKELKNDKQSKVYTGNDLEFLTRDMPYVVDWVGGRGSFASPTVKESVEEDVPTQALLLGPDGKLFLRSTIADTDTSEIRGRMRLDRYRLWRQRLLDVIGGKGDQH
jgi:hypothetical protein